MARSRARSALAALALGTALTAAACAPSDTPSGDAGTPGTPGSAGASGASHAARSPSPGPATGSGTGSGTATGPASHGVTSPASPGPSSAGPRLPSSPPESTGGGGDPGRTPWCTTDAVNVSLREGSPGAGNRYADLVLTNTSSAPCRTQGWPGLQLTGQRGALPTHAVRDSSEPARQVTLAPGDSASSRLHWTVVPGQEDPPTGDCPTPTALRVIPPDQHTSDTVPWGLGPICGKGRITALPLHGG
ncbi:DUF4232 domain-containing protein [Streptomyces sp. ODS28]|uniref:DUF4232 domain-containing protein n=1 Tax=Streptomyces sp. ODS28 TaxID=3136688 RepID=UPI0031E60AC4